MPPQMETLSLLSTACICALEAGRPAPQLACSGLHWSTAKTQCVAASELPMPCATLILAQQPCKLMLASEPACLRVWRLLSQHRLRTSTGTGARGVLSIHLDGMAFDRHLLPAASVPRAEAWNTLSARGPYLACAADLLYA